MPSLKITPMLQPQQPSSHEAGGVTAAALGQPSSRGGDDWWQPRNPLKTMPQPVVLEPSMRRGGQPQALAERPGLPPIPSESGGLVQPAFQRGSVGQDPRVTVGVHSKWKEEFGVVTVGVGPMATPGSPTQRIAAVPGQLTPDTSLSVQAVEMVYPNQATTQMLRVGLQSNHVAAVVTLVDNPGGKRDAVEYSGRAGVPEVNVSARYVDRPAPQGDTVAVAVNVPFKAEGGIAGEVALGVQCDPNEVKGRVDLKLSF